MSTSSAIPAVVILSFLISNLEALFFQLVGFAELQSRFVSQDLKMRYVAAAALAALGGQDVNEANIKKILR